MQLARADGQIDAAQDLSVLGADVQVADLQLSQEGLLCRA